MPCLLLVSSLILRDLQRLVREVWERERGWRERERLAVEDGETGGIEVIEAGVPIEIAC